MVRQLSLWAPDEPEPEPARPPAPRTAGKYLAVTLTADQLEYAERIGELRQRNGSQYRDAYGARLSYEEGRDLHQLGARGELAVAVAFGIVWQASLQVEKHGGDVGPYQVRTGQRSSDSLILRPGDDRREVYVLVVPGRADALLLVGWIRGADGCRPEWIREPGGRPPAWFVPQRALLPFPLP